MKPEDLRTIEQLIEDLQKVRSPQSIPVLRDVLAECTEEIRQLQSDVSDLLDACKFALNSPAPMDRHLVVKRLKAAIEKAEKRS